MDGILLIDKPTGWTSHDVVAKVRSVLRQGKAVRKIRVGHAGTLDPMATGLLIVLIGAATKQQDKFMKLDKTYEAEITLGATSTTDDTEGEILNSGPAGDSLRPSESDIKNVLEQFKGEVTQIPPQYSAIKVGGKRAYKTARAGGTTELKPRKVIIHSLDLKGYKYPLLRLECSVSSGTYIRSLARDIGEVLGTGAYLSSLRRTRVGKFKVQDAASPEEPFEKYINNLKEY